MAKIIQLYITPEMIDRAKLRLKTMPRLKNSITGNKATLHGFVGEELLSDFFEAQVTGEYDYDLIKNGVKIEIKTKRTTVEPQSNFEVSVAEYNIRQNCNYYAFIRLTKNFDNAWFLGVMPKPVYFMKARKLNKGQIDGTNNFVVKANCWNLRIDELLDCDKSYFGV